MSEKTKKQTIHEILKEAFDKVNERHNVRIGEVKFDYLFMLDGSAVLIGAKFNANSSR
jgi:hypothetical protein